MSENETVWSDDATNTASQADYQELQRQYDQLQTELFNERKKSAGLERIVEANALVHISAHNAEISAQAQDRYETLLLAIANGAKWPRYPLNGKIMAASAPFLELLSIRSPAKLQRPVFDFEDTERKLPTKTTPTIHRYSQHEVLEAESLLAQVQFETMVRAAERLVVTIIDRDFGTCKVIRYEHLKGLAMDVKATKRPI